MQQDKTTIDISNESLQDAAKKYAEDDCVDVKKRFMIGYTECFHLDSEGFKAGANWQKEKDKVIIDKLFQALKMATELLEENNNYPNSIRELRILINRFFKTNQNEQCNRYK